MIVDAGVLVVAADAADPNHKACRELLTGWSGELVVSAFTAAEADYLVLKRLGLDAELLFVEDLAHAYTVEPAGSSRPPLPSRDAARGRQLPPASRRRRWRPGFRCL